MANESNGGSRVSTGSRQLLARHERVADDPNGAAATAPIVPVILSGGVGTRLWPLSRTNMPKQVLPLWGTEPMIVGAAGRMGGVTGELAEIMGCGLAVSFLNPWVEILRQR